MDAAENQAEAPEWAAARNEWREQANTSIADLWNKLRDALPDDLTRDDVYPPVHDIAGLAPVFEYHLVGSMARALMEKLRQGPERLNEEALLISRTYITAIDAVHKRDIRGQADHEGEALLAKLAAIGV